MATHQLQVNTQLFSLSRNTYCYLSFALLLRLSVHRSIRLYWSTSRLTYASTVPQLTLLVTSWPVVFKHPHRFASNICFNFGYCTNFAADTNHYTLLQLHSNSTHIWGTSRVKPGLKDILNKCRASTAYSPLFFYPFLCILQRKRPNCQPREMCRHLLKHSRFR